MSTIKLRQAMREIQTMLEANPIAGLRSPFRQDAATWRNISDDGFDIAWTWEGHAVEVWLSIRFTGKRKLAMDLSISGPSAHRDLASTHVFVRLLDEVGALADRIVAHLGRYDVVVR